MASSDDLPDIGEYEEGTDWDASGSEDLGETADEGWAKPTDWMALTPEAKVDELARLRPFVAYLVVTYRLPPRTVPACWEKHPALVRDLSEIRDLYAVSFDQRAQAASAVDWGQRWYYYRSVVLPEDAAVTGCTVEHHPDDPQAWALDLQTNGEASRTWTAAQRDAEFAADQELQVIASRATALAGQGVL